VRGDREWIASILSAALAAAWVVATPALAADFDGSKRLICATVEARDCVSGNECFRGLPDEVGAPAFVRIDFERKSIVGPHRTTPILFMEKSDKQLLLQGTELGYAWVLALDPATGRFSASLTNTDGAFVLFGSCTPL
jgi:hypothetical protein